MIIFYHKKTGEIFGTIDGISHTPEEVKKLMIKPSSLNNRDVGKYVVHFKKQKNGFVPEKKIISDFMSGKKNIYDYKIKVNGKDVEFVKK